MHSTVSPAVSAIWPPLAEYAGDSVAAKPQFILGELIRQLRARPGIEDPVGIASAILPGVTPP
jgi:hypothetical protein